MLQWKQWQQQQETGQHSEVGRISVKFHSFTDKVLDALTDLHNDLDDKVDDLEQYGRRNCVLIHGMPEEESEQCMETVRNLFADKLKVPLSIQCFDRVRRIGKQRGKNSKSIVRKPPLGQDQ